MSDGMTAKFFVATRDGYDEYVVSDDGCESWNVMYIQKDKEPVVNDRHKLVGPLEVVIKALNIMSDLGITLNVLPPVQLADDLI